MNWGASGVQARLIVTGMLVLAFSGCARYKPIPVQAPRSKNFYRSSSPAELSQYIRTVLKISQEKTAAADEALRRLHERKPELAELSLRAANGQGETGALRLLAGAYLSENLYFSAFHHYQEIKAREGDDPAVELALARIWRVWGDYSMARQHAEQAVLLDPGSAEALELLGRILLDSREIASAISAFLAAARISPDSAQLHANTGYAYLLRGEYEKSRLHLELSVSLDGSIPEAHNNLGIALAWLGDREGALRQFMNVNDSAAAHNNLGTVYLAQKRWDQARQEFLQALSLAPDYLKAKSNLQEAESHLPPAPAVSHIPSEDAAFSIDEASPADPPLRIFRMMVYSSRSRNMVVAQARILAGAGYQAKVVRSDLKGNGVWYGVCVEGFDSRPAALEAAREMIGRRLITDYRIIS